MKQEFNDPKKIWTESLQFYTEQEAFYDDAIAKTKKQLKFYKDCKKDCQQGQLRAKKHLEEFKND